MWEAMGVGVGMGMGSKERNGDVEDMGNEMKE